MSPKKNEKDLSGKEETKKKTVKAALKAKKAVVKKTEKAAEKEISAQEKEKEAPETVSPSAVKPSPAKKLSLEEIKAKRKAALEKIKKKKESGVSAQPEEKKEEKVSQSPAVSSVSQPPAPHTPKPAAPKEDHFETFNISRDGAVLNAQRMASRSSSQPKKTEHKPPEHKAAEPQTVKEEPPKKEVKKENISESPVQEEVKKNLKTLDVSTQVTVRELAEKMGIKSVELIKKLMTMGIYATITQRLDPDVASLVALDYDYELNIVSLFSAEKSEDRQEQEDPENLKPRPPVITIMGHVDHGKTTLLDALRLSNVVDTEAGQITQHIGAYTIHTAKGDITVLDTPGHEAFTAMRAHGVKVTDIVILVVSAADGVMPQTVEAINHAKAANVPIIVAINKIDLPTANPQNIKQQLSGYDLLPEDWGGKVPMIEISAKKKINLDKLLEVVHIQAEIMELKANPDRKGQAIVIEAKKDPKKGILATIICTRGTISVGEPFLAGTTYGKIRALINDRGERIEKISPSFPGEILGLSGEIPMAGDIFRIMNSEKEARHIAETRIIHKKQEDIIHQKSVSLLSLKEQVDQKMLKTLNIVLKADVYGSMQAIRDSLEKLSNPEVAIHVLHSGIGHIIESDVMLAKASNAIIFGFNVEADEQIQMEAKKEGVELRTYKIIYDLLEELKAAMSGLLEPEIVETVTGKAEIRQIFDLSSGKVAGSIIKEGKITRGEMIKIIRDGSEVGSGKISGLKRFKEDVREVENGFECGILMDGFSDFRIGDSINAYMKEEKLRRLNV